MKADSKTARAPLVQSIRAFVSGVQLPPVPLRKKDKTEPYAHLILAMLMFNKGSLTPESTVAECDASRKQIEALMHISKRTLERRLAELRAAGVITVERRSQKSSLVTIYKSPNATVAEADADVANSLPPIEPFTSTPHHAWLHTQEKDCEIEGDTNHCFREELDALLSLFTDDARRAGVELNAARQALTDHTEERQRLLNAENGFEEEDNRSPEEKADDFDNRLNEFLKTDLQWTAGTQKHADKYGLQRDPDGNGLVIRDGRCYLWQDLRDGLTEAK
jgi:hypothetical protein